MTPRVAVIASWIYFGVNLLACLRKVGSIGFSYSLHLSHLRLAGYPALIVLWKFAWIVIKWSKWSVINRIYAQQNYRTQFHEKLLYQLLPYWTLNWVLWIFFPVGLRRYTFSWWKWIADLIKFIVQSRQIDAAYTEGCSNSFLNLFWG